MFLISEIPLYATPGVAEKAGGASHIRKRRPRGPHSRGVTFFYERGTPRAGLMEDHDAAAVVGGVAGRNLILAGIPVASSFSFS